MTPTQAREEAERIAGIAELEVMAFRSQDPEALDRLNQAMVQLRDDISTALLTAAKGESEMHRRAQKAEGELHQLQFKRNEELEAYRYGNDNIRRIAKKHGLSETLTDYGVVLALSDTVARLESAAKVKEGCVRTSDGVERTILGTLPLTADGCVVGLGCTIWNALFQEPNPLKIHNTAMWCESEPGSSPSQGSTLISDKKAWYSTRQAAEAAQNTEKNA